jgi:hypothetical protein
MVPTPRVCARRPGSSSTRAARWLAATVTLAAALGACTEGPTPPPAVELPVEMTTPRTPTPTLVASREPSATPTPEPDPMFPVESRVIPGVLVPYSAELVVFSTPRLGRDSEGVRAVADARADYFVPDADADALRDWFLENLPSAGWGEGEERDGTLFFLHTVEGSLREPGDEDDEGHRSATVFFDRGDGVSFTIIAEQQG